jgi:putative ABC transport system permease protein
MAGLKILRESSFLGVQTLWQNKFRSFLTILGVFIGVVIILAVASVLNGFRFDVVSQVEEFGSNTIFIYRFPFVNVGRLSPEVRNRKELSFGDAMAIDRLCPSVRSVTPALEKGGLFSVRHGRNEMNNPRLRGSLSSYLESPSSSLADGRNFTDGENTHGARVAVIGDAVKESLFPSVSAVGKSIVVAGKKLRVIGVVAKQKEGPFGSANPEDRLVLIPYSTFRKMDPRVTDHFIMAVARAGLRDEAMEEITSVLRVRRKVPYDEENNFELGTADSIIEAFDKIVAGALAVMFLLSTVAFLVGGVGVMNIMLVSVTERTREIGIRKAIGARKKDIITQFLTEAAVLTGIGGIVGMLFSEGLLSIVDGAVDQIHAVTPMWARVFALVGSRLDPIEALRFE